MRKSIDNPGKYQGRHLLLEPNLGLCKTRVLQRIIERTQRYQLFMSKRANLKPRESSYYPHDVYRPLMAIDYGQPFSNPISTFQIDRPFTIIDWRYAELIETKIDFADLESDD